MSSLTPNQVDFNIFTGELVYLPSPNFSYELIPSGCCIRIPEYQQMIVHQIITVDGLMIADGTVVILD